MNLLPAARSYLRRATVRLEAARGMLTAGHLPEVVRFSQEATELSLKAALRAVGVEYPKRHDPGEVLRESAARFPAWFRASIPTMVRTSARLAQNRELALYGDERLAKTAEELFRDAPEAAAWLAAATRVHRDCGRLLRHPPTGTHRGSDRAPASRSSRRSRSVRGR